MKTKQWVMCVVTAAAMTVGVVTAQAADLVTTRVNVPFSFRAGSVSLPAGEYSVIRENGMGLMRLEGRRGSTMLLAEPDNRPGFAPESELMFQHTAGGNVLTEVRSISGSFRLLNLAH